MLITRLQGGRHGASQPRPNLQSHRSLRPDIPENEHPPPTSSINSSSPDSLSSGTDSSSQPDHPIPAAMSHGISRSSLLYRRRDEGDASQGEAKRGDASQAEVKKCPVCSSRSCRLVSHQLYASRLKRCKSHSPRTNDKRPFTHIVRKSQSPITDNKMLQAFLTASIGKAWIDPYFDLPVGGRDAEMQRHFRDFFTTQVSSLTSPVRVRAFDVAYCSVMIHQALVDPALCHTVIAMAATYSAIHRHGLRAPDAKLLSIYDRTFKILRQQTAQADQSKQSSLIVMAMLNLLLCYGLAFGDKSIIAAHPTTMKNLVNACGGISNLSAQPAALSLWSDYYVTLYTGKKPTFLEEATVLPDIPLSNPPAAVYGCDLDDLRARGLISQKLLDICLNTCRLTELLEDRVSGNIIPARWEYFNYKRNAMPMRNGIVHAELFGSGTKAECIGLVHSLFLFLVLRLMPWNAPVINLCEQLQSALLASGLHDYWGSDIDVLLWVLFTLLAGAEGWDGKYWALELLLDTLTYRYRSEPSKWPLDWCEKQRRNLVRFTWSNLYLTVSLKATCQDLVVISQSPTRLSARQDALP